MNFRLFTEKLLFTLVMLDMGMPALAFQIWIGDN